jgi:hypothetical protein
MKGVTAKYGDENVNNAGFPGLFDRKLLFLR